MNPTEDTSKIIEQRLSAIEARNEKVELNKAWETSWARRISIALVTYGVTATYLIFIGSHRPLLEATIPSVGFLLSTMALSVVRKLWQAKRVLK